MTDEIIKACIDRSLPTELVVEAAQRAVEENPANAPVANVSPGIGAEPVLPSFMAALAGKKWRNGRTLRVSFMDGEPVVHAKVEEHAHRWSEYANVKFAFGSDPEAEIRVSFERKGSWSHVGTDALTVPKREPTMNFGWLTPNTHDDEYSRVVLHEFGHALGCIHEHQHPAAQIPWDKEAVYQYYTGPPNNWTRADVDFNLFHKYSRTVTQFATFDPKSIMLYPVDNQLTLGEFEIPWRNTQLSETDQEFIGVLYPFEEKPATELLTDGSWVKASIGRHGEEDLFRFVVSEAGAYEVQTGGFTNVVLTLLGPDNETDVIASDDDSGFLWNARVAAQLDPGLYYVRVRHHRPQGTGGYTIWVEAQE